MDGETVLVIILAVLGTQSPLYALILKNSIDIAELKAKTETIIKLLRDKVEEVI
jgi:hypothetical protein